MEPTKSISSEEEHTLENVSVEDGASDVEKGDVKTGDVAAKGENNARATVGLSRRAVFAWAILTFCLFVGFVGSLAAALKKPETHTSAVDALEADNTSSSVENLSFGEVEPPTFSKDVLQGYSSKEEFEADLTNMARYIVKNVIMWNLEHTNVYTGGMEFGEELENMNGDVESDDATIGAALEVAGTLSTASAAAAQKVTAHKGTETNNQEKSADEADLVKSDGNFLYASYSTYVLVMSHTGRVVKKLYTNTTKPDEWGNVPADYIRALFITDDHFVVVTEVQSYDASGNDVFSYASSTRVTAYTKPTATNTDMKLVKTTTVMGFYQDGRWMTDSNSLQILTAVDISVYMLTDPLNPQYFPWMSKADYIKKASELAETNLIPTFARVVLERLAVYGEMPEMLRLNTWSGEGTHKPWEMPDYYGSFNEALQRYLQITSINVNDFASEGKEMDVSTAGFFTPSYTVEFYGGGDSLVLSMATQLYNSTSGTNLETVFLLHSKIVSADGKTGTEFHSVKALEGRIRSRFSLDVQGNDLRIATTNQKWNPLDNVWSTCGDQAYHEDPCITDANWNACFEMAITCPAGMVVKTGCPATFACEDNGSSIEGEGSSTDNFVIVFDIEQQGEMMERGRVRIGEPHEVITAVRFGENFSYAMTFDQRDPFYVLDLKAGQAPAVKGSVKMGGFAAYLHPLNEEQTMLVGIGQNTTGTGLNQVNSGVLISIFDVSDPSKPKVVDSQMLTNPEEGTTSSSVVESDTKAIRYENGKLILPASIYPNSMPVDMFGNSSETPVPDFVFSMTTAPSIEDTFEGFVVYDISKKGLKEAFRVNHFFDMTGKCFPCETGVYSMRSFLYDDGTLVTIYGNILIGSNVTTGVELWSFDHSQGMDANSNNMCCY
jgi:Beta propeller domain